MTAESYGMECYHSDDTDSTQEVKRMISFFHPFACTFIRFFALYSPQLQTIYN